MTAVIIDVLASVNKHLHAFTTRYLPDPCGTVDNRATIIEGKQHTGVESLAES
jgi:hypothetical protein